MGEKERVRERQRRGRKSALEGRRERRRQRRKNTVFREQYRVRKSANGKDGKKATEEEREHGVFLLRSLVNKIIRKRESGTGGRG